MDICREVIEDIDYELRHREEIKERYNYDNELYYAHMTGRLQAVVDWLLYNTSNIAD